MHGFGGSSATYHAFVSELSESYETYAFDLLGMGCSGKPDIEYIKLSSRQTVDMFVDCMRQVVVGLGLPPVHIVAHSLGAYFSTFYIHRYFESVASFASVSCAGATSEPTDLGIQLKSLKLPLKRRLMRHFWEFMNRGLVRGHTAFSMMPIRWVISKWMEGRNEVTGD